LPEGATTRDIIKTMRAWLQEHGPQLAGFFLLTTLAFAGLAYLNRSGPPRAQVESTIVAVGDSWVEGVGATAGHDYVSVLSQRLGVPIINAGDTGDTTADVLQRLGRDVLVHEPTLVIVHVGGNDVIRLVPREVMRANLESIVQWISETGADVVLVGYRCSVIADDCDELFGDIARQYDAYLVPAVQDGIAGHPNLLSDPLHPNDEGYAKVADKVEPVLRRALREAEERAKVGTNPGKVN
jgi:lysophospholipase L1-like esterase